MTRHRIAGLLLGLCTGAGCSSSGNEHAASEAASNGQTSTSNAETQTASSSTSMTATTSNGASTTTSNGASTTTSTSTATAAGNGSGGAGSDGTTTGAGVGGAAGNADSTSEVTTTGAGGNEACPSELPSAESACPRVNQNCYYEDCSGAGRSIASCSDGGWSVSTAPCTETVFCTAGGADCSEGEICLIVAGGAFAQECVPNTCETGPVGCDCIEGCSGDCTTYGDPDNGITITCNTCPSGMACP